MLVSAEGFCEGASPKPSNGNVRARGEFGECRVFGIGKVCGDPAFNVHFCPAAAVTSRLEEFGGGAKTFLRSAPKNLIVSSPGADPARTARRPRRAPSPALFQQTHGSSKSVTDRPFPDKGL